MVYDVMMVYKGIIVLSQTATSNKDIREWRRKITNLKTWDTFKNFSTELIENSRKQSPEQGKGGTWRR